MKKLSGIWYLEQPYIPTSRVHAIFICKSRCSIVSCLNSFADDVIIRQKLDLTNQNTSSLLEITRVNRRLQCNNVTIYNFSLS